MSFSSSRFGLLFAALRAFLAFRRGESHAQRLFAEYVLAVFTRLEEILAQASAGTLPAPAVSRRASAAPSEPPSAAHNAPRPSSRPYWPVTPRRGNRQVATISPQSIARVTPCQLARRSRASRPAPVLTRHPTPSRTEPPATQKIGAWPQRLCLTYLFRLRIIIATPFRPSMPSPYSNAMTHRCETILPAASWNPMEASDSVLIDFDRRHRRRILLTTELGREVLLDLPQAVRLRHGDGLKTEFGIIRVVARPEPLAEIHGHDDGEMVRIAWHLGNRHLPVQLVGERIRIRRDHVIEDMVEQLGGHIDHIEAPFDPEAGAYAGGHTHLHDDDDHGHHHGDGKHHHHDH